MRKTLLLSIILTLFFALFAFTGLAIADGAKEITADPFELFGVGSLDEIASLIHHGKDKSHQKFTAKSMYFTIETEAVLGGLTDYSNYTPNTASQFTVNFDGTPTKIPFSTGKMIYQDDEWGKRTEEFSGQLLIKAEMKDDGQPSGKFKVDYIGTIYREYRLGKPDQPSDIYDLSYTEAEPLDITNFTKWASPGADNADLDHKRLTIRIGSSAHGTSYFYIYAYPQEITILPADIVKTDTVVDTVADDTPGETAGVPVAVAIVLGALGALGAAGALGAGGSSASAAEERKEKGKSKYQMVLYKEFGNKIRYNDNPVNVYAKMIELKPDGTKIDRPDLSQRIEIFSEDEVLRVSPATFSGEYANSSVRAQTQTAAAMPEEGVISFRFTGEGGSFQNNVTFALVGEPYISFPEQKSYSGIMLLEAIAGDGFNYEVDFELIDFALDAETIEFESDDPDLTLTYERIAPYSYKAIVTNNTAPIDAGPFAKGRRLEVSIKAFNKGEQAESNFSVMLYPEGLSIEGRIEDDHLIVDTAENKGGGVLDLSIKPTQLDIKLAVKTTDEQGKPKGVITTKGITLKKLEGTSNQTETLLTAFKYELNTEFKEKGTFYIEPGTTLPESTTKYYVTLPIEGSYEQENYSLDLPIRLLGVSPEKPDEWQIEHDKLIRDIQRFGMTSGGVAQQLMRASKNRTAFELSMIRRVLIEEGVRYYLNEATEFNKLADKLENLEAVFNVIKWFGDQATSYLLTIYAGPTADAFISPFKDYLLDFIGEAGAKIYWGEEVNFDSLSFMSSLASGVENQIGNIITGDKPPTPKAIGALVAGLALLNFSKHYLLEEETRHDFCKSVIATGGDMTVTAFVTLLGAKMDKMLKNKAFKEKVEGFIGNYINTGADSFFKDAKSKAGKFLHDKAQDITSSDIAKKYIEETFGFMVATVYDNITDRDEDQSLTAIRIPFGTYTIEIDPVANTAAIVNIIFELLNSVLEFIPDIIPTMPEYPIYYS